MSHDPAPLPPPQFSLRTLLFGVTLIGVGLGVCLWLSPPAIAAIVMGVLIVGAHVFGNAIGTRLRRGRTHTRYSTPMESVSRSHESEAPTAPATHLAGHWSLGWLLILPTIAGALLGIIGGCMWIQHVYQLGFDPEGMAIAGAGFGLLGGFASFALASFSQVLIVAVLQAMRHK